MEDVTPKTPKRVLDGRKNAGRSEILAASSPPDDFPPPITLIDVRGDDSEAQMLTVYLDTTRSDTEIGPNKDFKPYVVALIEWGQDGYQSQAEVDFSVGTAFSVTASYLRVKAALDRAAYIGLVAAAQQAIRTAAQVSYGTRPGYTRAPTRTLWFRGILAGVTSAEQPIPRFARSLSLAWDAVTFPVPAHRLELLDSAGAIVSVRFAGPGGSDGSDFVPLPSDARLVRVTNAGAAAVNLRVMADLAF